MVLSLHKRDESAHASRTRLDQDLGVRGVAPGKGGVSDRQYIRRPRGAILVADHCDESWWYAADFSGAPDTITIYLVDGERPAKVVARSFTGFVNGALADAADSGRSSPGDGCGLSLCLCS
jgi:hypothetical protein